MQSRGPLFVRSKSCSVREACVPGPPGKWLPQEFRTQAHLPTACLADSRDQVTRGSVALPYISRLSEFICRILAPLAFQITYRPFSTLRQELVHPKDPVPTNFKKGWRHIRHHQSPLNRERGTLRCFHLASSHYCVVTIINLAFLFSL